MSISSTVNSLSTVFMVGKAAWNVYNMMNAPSIVAPGIVEDAYRPSSWGKYGTDESQMLYLAPNISEKKKKVSPAGESAKSQSEIEVGYFFDAFVRESHAGSVKITDHPVQGGWNISDHAYNLPDSLTIEVFSSDSMDTIKTNQFKDYSTKSVSVYEILRSLKERRVLVSVRTRLRRYENMIIEKMSSTDDYKTANSFRCVVSLRQIMVAVVSKEYVAVEKKNVKDTNGKGQQQASESDNASKIVKIGRGRGK